MGRHAFYTWEVSILSCLKPERILLHDDSIGIAKKQKSSLLRMKKEKVDENNCSFISELNNEIQDVTSANDDSNVQHT